MAADLEWDTTTSVGTAMNLARHNPTGTWEGIIARWRRDGIQAGWKRDRPDRPETGRAERTTT